MYSHTLFLKIFAIVFGAYILPVRVDCFPEIAVLLLVRQDWMHG